MGFLNNVCFVSCAVILCLRGNLATEYTQFKMDDDLWESDGLPKLDKSSDTKRNELMLDSKLAVWQLLENKTARTTISEFFNLVKQIHENKISAQMMVGVVEQIQTVLTNKYKAALSVKHLTDGVVELATSKQAAPTIKAIYKSVHRFIQDPNTVQWLHKIFDFLKGCSMAYRGPELISSLVSGICDIMQKPDPKDQIIKAFENGKYIIMTPMKEKIGNFLKASTKSKAN